MGTKPKMTTERSSQQEAPKAFISYSWGNSDHDQWILDLASELAENGIDIILDKYDLKENDDKYAFMERMVTDPTVKKVIMVCDKKYQEKADSRSGGVGTETQIISNEVYQKIQSAEDKAHKFCAVIKEKDAHGKPYLPTYLKSRIHIDMSDAEARDANFEQLVRWIFDKPLFTKPTIGQPPSFLFVNDELNLQTSSRFRLAVKAIKEQRPNGIAYLKDYFEIFATRLADLTITPNENLAFDDQVIESINAFLPYRNEFVELIRVLSDYGIIGSYAEAIHDFFESVLPYVFSDDQFDNHSADMRRDNFRFIIPELFLLTNAVLIKRRKFEWVNELLYKEYYLERQLQYYADTPKFHPYFRMRQNLPSFESRMKRLQLTVALIPTLLLERKSPDLSTAEIVQADFVLYLRDNLTPAFLDRGRWWPSTLSNGVPYGQLEAFSRSESQSFFDRFKIAIGAADKDELGKFIEKYAGMGLERLHIDQLHIVDIAALSNYELIATKP